MDEFGKKVQDKGSEITKIVFGLIFWIIVVVILVSLLASLF